MIALIGEKEIWRSLSPLGVKVIEAESREEVLSSIDKVKEGSYQLVFISEEVAGTIEDLLDEIYKSKDLNLVLLPKLVVDNIKNKDSLSFIRLKKVVEKAMGIDIL